MIEYRPAQGAGSCEHCRGALGLDAVHENGRWYCCSSCARGLAPERENALDETKLYHRPKRFFRRRLPKELRSAARRS